MIKITILDFYHQRPFKLCWILMTTEESFAQIWLIWLTKQDVSIRKVEKAPLRMKLVRTSVFWS